MTSMNMDKILGNMVLLKLDNWEELEPFGIEGEHVYARVIGMGDFGLWIENTSFEAAPVTSSTAESCLAYVLVSWNHVKSVVFFPNIEDESLFDYDKVKSLGFHSKK